MNNYNFNVSMGVKEMYMNLNNKVQEMDNKFKEIYNNPAYTQAHKGQQHLKLKQAIKNLHSETRENAIKMLNEEKLIMEQQQKDLFNSSVDKMDRIYNLMLFNIDPKRAIEISIETGDIPNAITMLEVSKDRIKLEEQLELEKRVYNLTNTAEIQHLDRLINKLSYHNSETGIITDIILDYDSGDIVDYGVYTYQPIENYSEVPQDIF